MEIVAKIWMVDTDVELDSLHNRGIDVEVAANLVTPKNFNCLKTMFMKCAGNADD